MSRREQIAVGLAVGFLCPYLTFVLFWWTSAALALAQILFIPDRGIAAAALTGLALGIILDAVFLKRWIARFYGASLKLLVPVYLFCSVIAVASFMGFPLGNLALGTLAGVYVGRRTRHAGGQPESAANSARRAGFFIAMVTGLEALPISILALKEGVVVRMLQAGLGMSKGAVTGPPGIGVAILACIAVTSVQFVCTRAAARFAFDL
jgi:hypothetical protein